AIDADWDLFGRLQQQNAFLGEYSPANRLSGRIRTGLAQAADDVIERYRNSSDPTLQNFDWQKAVVCLRHLLEMDRSDRDVQGKLALCNGYENLMRGSGHAAQSNFEEAVALLPRSPDPHLALARFYVYSEKNIGKAVAQFDEAQRLGHKPGPREIEQ